MQYFAQDEATRLDPTKTVYETMQADSPIGMVPMIRNILGGFLFAGDDIYKKAGVLSGGERTRLAVARMLLRPANTLLLDEPTNHLDLDSKDVLLEALEDFGGTLIFVSQDRLATKIVAVGGGGIEVYPGTYEQFLWSRAQRAAAPSSRTGTKPPTKPLPGNEPTHPDVRSGRSAASTDVAAAAPAPRPSYDEKKRAETELRRQRRQADDRSRRIADLEGRIARAEQAIKTIEAEMAQPGFYSDRATAEATVARHKALMWEVGDLMNQWELVQTHQSTGRD